MIKKYRDRFHCMWKLNHNIPNIEAYIGKYPREKTHILIIEFNGYYEKHGEKLDTTTRDLHDYYKIKDSGKAIDRFELETYSNKYYNQYQKIGTKKSTFRFANIAVPNNVSQTVIIGIAINTFYKVMYKLGIYK